MSAPHRELEIKLQLSDEQLQHLRGQLGTKSAGASTRLVQSTYYDTADQALRARGIALRVRRVGRAWIQTVKAERMVVGGVSNPIEAECEIESERPDLSAIADKTMRRRIKSAIGHADLLPRFKTDFKRTRKNFETEAGDRIEVALDVGSVETPAGSQRLCELELELKTGRPTALLALAPVLVAVGPLHTSPHSKADLGYRLLEARPDAPPTPSKAAAAEIAAGQTGLEAFRACCRAAADQIAHNWHVVQASPDPEGPHQMRVGLRRLRTALRMFRPLVDTDRLLSLNDKLKDLARLVGEIRDLDVLSAEIVEPLIGRTTSDRGLHTLLAVLAEEGARWRSELRAVLGDREHSLDLIEIALFPRCLDAIVADGEGGETGRLDKPIEKLADGMIERRWRAVAKRGQRIDALDVEERHELRKDLKKLRYTVDFLAPLFSRGRVRSFLGHVTSLQDVFGYLNDVALAQRLPEIHAVAAADDAEVHRAVGVVIGWHGAKAERAWESARDSWSELRRCEKFWKA